jgi:NAD(P) transhydrogenase subunit alpha
MRVGIPRETIAGETRVALVPELVPTLTRVRHEVLVEAGAGAAAGFADSQYRAAGAILVASAAALYDRVDATFKVQPPQLRGPTGAPEVESLRPGSAYIGFLSPFTRTELLSACAQRRITAYAMELVPRIARAQSMDALSSMATVAGYKAVLLAADRLGKMLPLLMTAAGTVAPARVLVLGAGVAGLQAIATAKRLGARVDAFDPRAAVREQVESLGAGFVEMALPAAGETTQGYAAGQSAAFLERERMAIAAHLPHADIVITTAQIFGQRAPLLLTASMLDAMPPGSIVVDLAAEQGGNCELTQPGQIIEYRGVSVIGAVNLPASVPRDASQLYAHNVVNLFLHLYPDGSELAEPAGQSDEIGASVCVTRNGEIVNPRLAALAAGHVAADAIGNAGAPQSMEGARS